MSEIEKKFKRLIEQAELHTLRMFKQDLKKQYIKKRLSIMQEELKKIQLVLHLYILNVWV